MTHRRPTTDPATLRRAIGKLRGLTADEVAELTGTTTATIETQARQLLDRRSYVETQSRLHPNRPLAEIVGSYDGGGILLDQADPRATVVDAVAAYRDRSRSVAVDRDEPDDERRRRVAARLAGTHQEVDA